MLFRSPNAVEAWTEYRRTGYPYLMALYDTSLPAKIGADPKSRAPERYNFSADEFKGNQAALDKMNELLDGRPDKGGTKLWWVNPDRPVQR